MRDIRYLTSHYDEKIKSINDFGAPLNFVFITDEHNREHCPLPLDQWARGEGDFELAADHIRSIQYILDRCPGISCVVNGGDIGKYSTDPVVTRAANREVMDALYSLSVPVHCCIGNHDSSEWLVENPDCEEDAILPEELHELCMKYNPTKENYYYTDFPEAGYRFIFLNSCDRPYRRDAEGRMIMDYPLEISNRQANWLEKEALLTEHKIMIFSHAPVSNEHLFGTVGRGGGYVRSHDDTLNSSRVWTAIASCPKVSALIHGHVHYDNLLYRDRMVVVTTLSSYADTWAPSCPPREIGTITETAFDVFSIKGNLMKITRFGAGCDRMATLLR